MWSSVLEQGILPSSFMSGTHCCPPTSWPLSCVPTVAVWVPGRTHSSDHSTYGVQGQAAGCGTVKETADVSSRRPIGPGVRLAAPVCTCRRLVCVLSPPVHVSCSEEKFHSDQNFGYSCGSKESRYTCPQDYLPTLSSLGEAPTLSS